MSVFSSPYLQAVLNTPVLSRIRRNHGLEHATLHVLARRFPRRSMGGHSNPNGFWLIGDLPTEAVEQAVHEALQRMRAGEHNLAIHPGCGTNYATAGLLAGLAGLVGMWGVGPRKRDKLERLPLLATLATVALMFAQPLGLRLQRYITTSGEPGNLDIVGVYPVTRGRVKAHQVITRG